MSTSAISRERLNEQINRLPRFPLGHWPTPLERLDRFSAVLGGPTVWIKRDDCSGLAFGGNKTRHNEFLLADALKKEADLFVWGAGVQSNNCRQTAAACAKAKLDCHLVLGRGKPADGPDVIQGNLLIDHLVGASIEIVEEPVGSQLDARIDAVAEQYRSAGRRVYAWDRDTVKPLAAVSYALCLTELLEQCGQQDVEPTALYICSAGSTGSGLALAAAAMGCSFPVRSICPIRWEWDTQEDMARIANLTAELLDIDTRLSKDDVSVNFDYIGPGYGIVSPGGLEAIALLARTEGILLDPIYSGKAMAGLIDQIRNGRFQEGDNIIFIHTGGTPALFAYNEDLTAGIAARTL